MFPRPASRVSGMRARYGPRTREWTREWTRRGREEDEKDKRAQNARRRPPTRPRPLAGSRGDTSSQGQLHGWGGGSIRFGRVLHTKTSRRRRFGQSHCLSCRHHVRVTLPQPVPFYAFFFAANAWGYTPRASPRALFPMIKRSMCVSGVPGYRLPTCPSYPWAASTCEASMICQARPAAAVGLEASKNTSSLCARIRG